MIEVPEGLKRAVEDFRDRLLKEERAVIYHDTDPDGIVAGALLEKLLRENRVGVEAHAKDREEVRFEPGGVYVLADIRIDDKILDEMRKSGAKIYYIDHHEPVGVTEDTTVLNPWFVEGLPVDPYKYNTALLAWFVEGMKEEDEWKVAAAHWADHAEDVHTKKWMERMRRKYPVEEIGKLIGLPDFFPELSLDEIRRRVRDAKDYGEIVEDEELRSRSDLLKKEIEKWIKVGGRESGSVVYLLVESPIRKVRSPVSTILSDRYPEKIFIIGQNNNNGTISYSLKFQNAAKYGVHLGEIAREAGKLFNGRGGGHPPAAGLKIPREKEPEFREWIKGKLKYFRSSPA